MNNAERRFLDNITSLPSLNVPKLHRVVTGVIIFLVLAAGLIGGTIAMGLFNYFQKRKASDAL